MTEEAASNTEAKEEGVAPAATTDSKTTTKLQDMEARAVAEASASADAAFSPSPSLLNASSPLALLQQIDGPSLSTYEGKQSVYVGRSVPVATGAKLIVPIQVTAPGSVVEYSVESKYYDIGFGITAEREEGITVVKETIRVESHVAPINGKFLVGSVPCLINFLFDNEYSWFREKIVSYKITVTPPSRETLMAGRRRRAKACLKAVLDDLSSAEQRLEQASAQKQTLEQQVQRLMQELEEKKKSLQVAENEEKWLVGRVTLRNGQKDLLRERLKDGWDDEKPPTTASTTTTANGGKSS